MIGFLQPLALLALTAAAIPTLLHLLGRRLPPVVVFPAVRYLTATEREHSRRLRLRNLLLLLLRTAVIACLVLGAARPVLRLSAGRSHAPTAMALVLDNSLSSSAVIGGRRSLDLLMEAAREVLDRVEAGDRLWLAFADGVPIRMTRLEAAATLDSLAPSTLRLDVGAAVRAAARAVRDDPLPAGEVVLFSDLQASAMSDGAEVGIPVLAWRPPPPPPNHWVDSVFVDPPVWVREGAVVVTLGGSASGPVPARLTVDGIETGQSVLEAGNQAVLRGSVRGRGWFVARVELSADELRADDRRLMAVRSAEPARARANPGAGSFAAAALSTLQTGGRVGEGADVVLDDRPHSGTTVVFPPSDPAMVGAVNRSLGARGVEWRFGPLLEGEWALGGALSVGQETTVFRRYRLVGMGATLAEVGGEPWLVRAPDLVLVASRFEPEWTDLPLTAAFVPFLDFLVNRVAAGESWLLTAAPGDVVEVPPGIASLDGGGVTISVPLGGRVTAPRDQGVYFLTRPSGDTVGALEVNYDPRESRLEQAGERALRAAFGGQTRLLSSAALDRDVLRGANRADLAGLFLIAALLAALAEFAVAAYGTGSRSGG